MQAAHARSPTPAPLAARASPPQPPLAAAAMSGAPPQPSPAAALQPTWDPQSHWDPEVEAFMGGALGADRLAAASAALVRPPATTCLRVNTTRATPAEVLRRLHEALPPSDRDALAGAHAHPLAPSALLLPGSGPHAVDYAATRGLEVVLGRPAGEAVLRGAEAFAPGVLAASAGIAAGDLVAVSVALELRSAAGGGGEPRYGLTRGTVLPRGDLPLDDPRLPHRARLFVGTAIAEVARAGMFAGRGGVAVRMVDRVWRAPSLAGAID